MRSGERNNLFLVWLLVIGMIIGGWLFIRSRQSEEDQVRRSAMSALQAIAKHDPAGICKQLSPELIDEIKHLNFSEFQFSLPGDLFCLQAAQTVFSHYGDYYISASSFYQMRTAKVSIRNGQALVFFKDGDRQNVSTWIKRDGHWQLRSGVTELIGAVVSKNSTIPGRPKYP